MREIRPEYKRDMNHNYLILPAEREIDTDSYQVRMMMGNVVPCLLKCRIQGIDGKCMVYYEITSRQSVEALYEKKKMKIEDLQIILGGFVHAMEEMSEHLLNPGQLLIQPEYMYMDVEKGEIGFCCMPGYQKEIREQFQTLAEYILPRLDHEDAKAVMLGYGVYRRALEDTFRLEHIKEELYGIRRGNNDPAGFSDKTSKSGEIRQNVFNTDWEEDKDGIREPGSEGDWLKFPGGEKMQKMPGDRSIREEPKSRRRKTGKRSAIFLLRPSYFLQWPLPHFWDICQKWRQV
ncbi:MAG: DUF6382 domain-containing protein [Clostridiales bacterium]|nr:DUF6382 domain-containing protein [Clostridiales bacterium]